jgi:hypothetical protein
MIMSNDYAKGFKEGFAAGLEEGKKLATPRPSWPDIGTISIAGAVGAEYDNMASQYADWAGNPTSVQSDK